MARAPIYFFRHGETDWNAEGRTQGRADRPLNETGRRQASVTGMALTGHFALRNLHPDDFDYVSSPLWRAQETMTRFSKEHHQRRAGSCRKVGSFGCRATRSK